MFPLESLYNPYAIYARIPYEEPVKLRMPRPLSRSRQASENLEASSLIGM